MKKIYIVGRPGPQGVISELIREQFTRQGASVGVRVIDTEEACKMFPGGYLKVGPSNPLELRSKSKFLLESNFYEMPDTFKEKRKTAFETAFSQSVGKRRKCTKLKRKRS